MRKHEAHRSADLELYSRPGDQEMQAIEPDPQFLNLFHILQIAFLMLANRVSDVNWFSPPAYCPETWDNKPVEKIHPLTHSIA